MTTPDSLTDQPGRDTQGSVVGEGLNSPSGQPVPDTHGWRAAGGASSDPLPDRTQTGNGHAITDTHWRRAVAPTRPAPASAPAMPKDRPPVLDDPLLALAADVLDDLETVRIGNQNRLRQLTRNQADADGEERGFGLTLDHPDVARLAALVDELAKAEHAAELNLSRFLRRHPLGPWVKSMRGVGNKQAARLLAAIGDPYIRPEMRYPDGRVELSRPRRVSELWAFCGYHVIKLPAGQTRSDAPGMGASGAPTSARQITVESQDDDVGGTNLPAGHHVDDAQGPLAGGDLNGSDPDQDRRDTQSSSVWVAAHRRRGVKANWSPTARDRAHLVAESCIKQLVKPCAVDDTLGHVVHVEDCRCSPYRIVYDTGRAKYADSVHATACVHCRPSGEPPAPPGSPLSAGHKHARALRLAVKEILKDLWREAKQLHEVTS